MRTLVTQREIIGQQSVAVTILVLTSVGRAITSVLIFRSQRLPRAPLDSEKLIA